MALICKNPEVSPLKLFVMTFGREGEIFFLCARLQTLCSRGTQSISKAQFTQSAQVKRITFSPKRRLKFSWSAPGVEKALRKLNLVIRRLERGGADEGKIGYERIPPPSHLSRPSTSHPHLTPELLLPPPANPLPVPPDWHRGAKVRGISASDPYSLAGTRDPWPFDCYCYFGGGLTLLQPQTTLTTTALDHDLTLDPTHDLRSNTRLRRPVAPRALRQDGVQRQTGSQCQRVHCQPQRDSHSAGSAKLESRLFHRRRSSAVHQHSILRL
jgi:hypothetical protein